MRCVTTSARSPETIVVSSLMGRLQGVRDDDLGRCRSLAWRTARGRWSRSRPSWRRWQQPSDAHCHCSRSRGPSPRRRDSGQQHPSRRARPVVRRSRRARPTSEDEQGRARLPSEGRDAGGGARLLAPTGPRRDTDWKEDYNHHHETARSAIRCQPATLQPAPTMKIDLTDVFIRVRPENLALHRTRVPPSHDRSGNNGSRPRATEP